MQHNFFSVLIICVYKISHISSNNLFPTTEECGLFTEEKIVKGEETELGEHPWTALLRYKSDNLCGGVLINKNYVLTAAHCVTPELESVTLGEHNVRTDIDCDEYNSCAPKPVTIAIEEKVVHPAYSIAKRNLPNDIALLKLKENVKYSEYIKPICLPLSPEYQNKKYTGNDFFVVGWGTTESGSSSEVKLKAQVTVVDQQTCSSYYNRAKVMLNENQFCAGGQGKGSCVGDSGGPLMTVYKNKSEPSWYAVGLVSLGRKDCSKGVIWPGIFTHVAKYVDWIVKTVRA